MIEEWRPVPGWETYYEVSSHGRVRSLPSGRCHKSGPRIRQAKPHPTRGYPMLTLKRKGRKQETFCVHRLVAAAFIGPCPAGKEVRHKDGTRDNNRVDNLEYGTRTENMMDRVAHGTAPRGEKNVRAKLTEDQVVSIRRGSLSDIEWSKRLGVSDATVYDARMGRTWAWVEA